MRQCKVKIGDRVKHPEDLFGRTESTVKRIEMGFRLGDGVQWTESDAGNLSIDSYIDRTGEEPVFVFKEHEEKVFNKTWDQAKQEFVSTPGGTKIIPEERLPFYGYLVSVMNEDMSTLFPERSLTLVNPEPETKAEKAIKRTKVGENYFQSGHGRWIRKGVVIWEIDGKLYAKDKDNWRTDMHPLEGKLEGYVRVNRVSNAHATGHIYIQITRPKEHEMVNDHSPFGMTLWKDNDVNQKFYVDMDKIVSDYYANWDHTDEMPWERQLLVFMGEHYGSYQGVTDEQWNVLFKANTLYKAKQESKQVN